VYVHRFDDESNGTNGSERHLQKLKQELVMVVQAGVSISQDQFLLLLFQKSSELSTSSGDILRFESSMVASFQCSFRSSTSPRDQERTV
jgi:hypothetical protein